MDVRVILFGPTGAIGPADLPADAPSRLVADELTRILDRIAPDTRDAPAPGAAVTARLAIGRIRRLVGPDETLEEAGLRKGDAVWLVNGSAEMSPASRTASPATAASIALTARQPPRPRSETGIALNRTEPRRPAPAPGIALSPNSVAIERNAARSQP